MNSSFLTAELFIPAATGLLLLLVFVFLYRETRVDYVRLWTWGWLAFCVSFALQAWNIFGLPNRLTLWGAEAGLFLLAFFIFVSTRYIAGRKRAFEWPDWSLLAACLLWMGLGVGATDGPPVLLLGGVQVALHSDWATVLLSLISVYRFGVHGSRTRSVGSRMLAAAVGFWAILLISGHLELVLPAFVLNVAQLLRPLPHITIGIAMVMVLFESERRRVEDSLLTFANLDVDFSRVLAPNELTPAMEKLLGSMAGLVGAERAVLYIYNRWSNVLPSTQIGFSPELLVALTPEAEQLQLEQPVTRLSDVVFPGGLSVVLAKHQAGSAALLALETRERKFGFAVLPGSASGSFQVSLLSSAAQQLGSTLEKYVLMHQERRRTAEYELLTQIGQVVSSRLDPDEVLAAVQKELGRLLDADNFYVAFLEDERVRFELEVIDGKRLPKRSRKVTEDVTEFVIRSNQPLLIAEGMEEFRLRHKLVRTGKPARSFCAVPIAIQNRPVGIMAAMNHEREFVFDQRDLEVMTTAAGQVAVAMENAWLFKEQQHRSRYLEFLNNISKTAISSQDADQMLPEIVSEIQKNFQFDHIGIGILDYILKEIEIKAEAGTAASTLGKRIPLGVGIVGRVARNREVVLCQTKFETRLLGILPDAESVLSLPVVYGETVLGVLNIESRRESAFAPEDVLILRTLADLLATALHNVFIFQKMQQQSITDALTSIKTRRYFLEALQSEWKRASRSGRPFSVVLIDLDKFKEVNDSMGHLEGDLVLARVGRLLEQKVRQSNVVARYGGDEFVILMPETGVEQAQILSERLRLWIATDPMLNERSVTGSFGVASYPVHGSTVEEIVRVADAGMYVSKHAGGNKVSSAESFTEGEPGSQRHVIAAYVAGFLRREPGPNSAEELITTLTKLSNQDGGNAEAIMEGIRSVTRAAETREMHAAGHGETVAGFAEALGRELRLPEPEVADLVFAARVHDVGKIIVPERILNKESSLTPEEFALVRRHSEIGGQIVATIPGGERIAQAVRHHHERVDGGGYPDGLKGEQIPLAARIIAVVDAYVNMVAERPYAPLRTHTEAIAELQAHSGTQFDGMLVRVLMQHIRGTRTAKAGV